MEDIVLKPFVLVMILLHSPQRMIPATQWFDTVSECDRALAEQTNRMMRADDDEAELRVLNIGGSEVLVVTSKRFMAWCDDSRLLAPDVLSNLVSPRD